MASPTLWCPSCGAEYVAGSRTCADCRVTLVADPPDPGSVAVVEGETGGDLVEMGEWPRLQAQILRRRLETAGVTVMLEWSGPGPDAVGTMVVPATQADFADAVINEIDVDDEVPDTSPLAYVARVEEHLAAISALLDELRTRLDETDR
jgi:hypothetical protein